MYKLDRTAFKIQTFEEADDDVEFWATLTTHEIFDFSWHLTCRTYDLDPDKEHRMDRTVFNIVHRD